MKVKHEIRGWLIGAVQGMDAAVCATVSACAKVLHFANLGEALATAAGPPDLIVVLRPHPDEYRADEVQSLLSKWPLARLVCIDGPWCASAGRTRSQWPLACCVPVEFAALRIAMESQVIQGSIPPLPLTAAYDEIFAFEPR